MHIEKSARIVTLDSYCCIWHCTKNHIFFFRTSWKDDLSKKSSLEYDLSCIIGRSENMILHVRRKMKDDLSEKIHRNMIFSSGLLKIWSFQKVLHRHMTFLVLSGKMVFFFRKIFLPQTENKWRPFPGNTWKHNASPSEKKYRKPDT